MSAAGGYARCDAATDLIGDVTQAFGSWPDPLGIASYPTDFVLSFYATYTEASTALSVASAAISCASAVPTLVPSVATLTIDNPTFVVAATAPTLSIGQWSGDFIGRAQQTLSKLEIWFAGAWLDVTTLGGHDYLKSANLHVGGAGVGADPMAGTWSATIANDNGIFHPNHPTSAYATLFQIGRRVRISVGRMHNGAAYYWQRLIGYMDAPRFSHGSRTVSISGCDYMKHLTDTVLRHPGNYFGALATFNSVSSSGRYRVRTLRPGRRLCCDGHRIELHRRQLDGYELRHHLGLGRRGRLALRRAG